MLLALVVSLLVGLVAYWAGGYSVWTFLAGGYVVGMAGVGVLNCRKAGQQQTPLPTRPEFEAAALALGGLFLVIGAMLLACAAFDRHSGLLRLGLDMLFGACPFILALRGMKRAKPPPPAGLEEGKN